MHDPPLSSMRRSTRDITTYILSITEIATDCLPYANKYMAGSMLRTSFAHGLSPNTPKLLRISDCQFMRVQSLWDYGFYFVSLGVTFGNYDDKHALTLYINLYIYV